MTRLNVDHVYHSALRAHQLPQGISVLSLAQLALTFCQMAKDLRSQGASASLQEAFQGAIAAAAGNARDLTVDERTAVQNTLFTAFDGLPRRHAATRVRSDFLRQVRLPVAERFVSARVEAMSA